MSATSLAQPVGHNHSITRVTRGIPGDARNPSRKLTYLISVIQQPERARACGSGAKSSADRRPVDPPPVVQLRIMEGENADTDITFAYNANFFLFATLEAVRNIAHGRAHPAPPAIPVLTGMPVSGMAYLDRPSEAGYFIFPDLSVRHEGQYKLSFNLYEQTKEQKDMDLEPPIDTKPKMMGLEQPGSSFDWRLTVKSNPFLVFSAKKFPGLHESTVLSRTVAEQGCRVRIRRDVRMRRREESGKGFDNESLDPYAQRSRGIEAPQNAYSRDRPHSLGGDDSRRVSPDHFVPLNNAYRTPSLSPSPTLPEASAHDRMHPLGWMKSNNESGPQFAAPPPAAQPPQHPQQPYQGQHYHHPPPPPPPQQPPHAQTQHHAPVQHQYRGPPAPAPPPPQAYAQDRQFHQPGYPAHPPREQPQHYDDPHRRHSVAYPPTQTAAPLPPNVFHPAVDSNHQHRPSFSGFHRAPSPALHPVLPPLKAPLMNQYPEDLRSPAGQLPPFRTTAPPYSNQNHIQPSEPAPYSSYPRTQPPPLSELTGSKRVHDVAFNSPPQAPLRNGARPESSAHEEIPSSDEAIPLTYRRAAGNRITRPPPIIHES